MKKKIQDNWLIFYLYAKIMAYTLHCTTPSKLVVYKPMGAEREADHTIAQSYSFIPFSRSVQCQNNFALGSSVDLRDVIVL